MTVDVRDAYGEGGGGATKHGEVRYAAMYMCG